MYLMTLLTFFIQFHIFFFLQIVTGVLVYRATNPLLSTQF